MDVFDQKMNCICLTRFQGLVQKAGIKMDLKNIKILVCSGYNLMNLVQKFFLLISKIQQMLSYQHQRVMTSEFHCNQISGAMVEQ